MTIAPILASVVLVILSMFPANGFAQSTSLEMPVGRPRGPVLDRTGALLLLGFGVAALASKSFEACWSRQSARPRSRCPRTGCSKAGSSPVIQA